jgi:hypothetical protein
MTILGLTDEKYPHQSTCLIDDPLMSSTLGLIEGLMTILALFVRLLFMPCTFQGLRSVICKIDWCGRHLTGSYS